jgi:single-strand DNA-binding protein
MTIIISGIGRIGKDAVTRHTSAGDSVTGFSLAMDDGFGDRKVTHWFDVSGWGKRYEGVAANLTKGAQVFVNGEYGEREHEGKTYKTIRLHTFDFAGSKPSQDRSAQRQESSAPAGGFEDDSLDDLPF